MKPTFPEVRRLADIAAANAQKMFVALNLAQLAFLILAAVVAGITPSETAGKHLISWVVCVFMFLALISSVALWAGRFDVRWFKCRAFAENAKSLAWRFVMVEGDGCTSSRDTYISEWKRLQIRLPELTREFAVVSDSGTIFTDWMNASRQLALPDKIELYRKQRLEDQIRWYAAKSRTNALSRTTWFWLLFAVEFAAICIAAIEAWRLPSFNIVGTVSAVGSAFIAWTQLKRHSDLSTSYAIAAEDLTLISERFVNVANQESLNEFVNDTEDAISREHSMWLARRNC